MWICRCLWRSSFVNRMDLAGYVRKISTFLLENRATHRDLSFSIFRKTHKMVCTAGQTEEKKKWHTFLQSKLVNLLPHRSQPVVLAQALLPRGLGTAVPALPRTQHTTDPGLCVARQPARGLKLKRVRKSSAEQGLISDA